jgi:F-type H+-transporting ATPase subunit b
MAAETTTAEVGHEAKGAFPPFDSTTFVPQLFWLAIAFTILFVALERLVLPRIASVLRARAQKVAGDLNTAERLRKEAEAALKAYEKAIAEARARAAGFAAENRTALKAEIDKRRSEVDRELARQIASAEADIRAARARAVEAVRGVAVEVAGEVVAKVMNERPSPAALARAVDAELGKLQAAE